MRHLYKMNEHPSSYSYGRANFIKPHFKKQLRPCPFFFYLLGKKKKKKENRQKYKMMQTAISLEYFQLCPPFSIHVNIEGRVQQKRRIRCLKQAIGDGGTLLCKEETADECSSLTALTQLYQKRGCDWEMNCPFFPLCDPLSNSQDFHTCY